jgi:pimeloyl-ACP methyl ester carboxylesterase
MISPTINESMFDTRDGGRLRYATAGEGEPVVFIHGFGLDMQMWDPQLQAFVKAYRVIRYDMRGYGHSSLPSAPYSHVDDLRQLLEFLGALPAHLVGPSLGGRVALRVAAQYPKAVRSLVLADPALDGHAWTADWLNRWRSMTDAAKGGDLKQAKKRWREHVLFEPANKDPEVADALRVMIERYSGWHLAHDDPGTAPLQKAGQMLSGISTPALVLIGELDLPDFQNIARRLGRELAGAELHTLAGAGHMSNMEAPQAFNERVLKFLQRC